MAFAIWSTPYSKTFIAAKGNWKNLNVAEIAKAENQFVVKPFEKDADFFALDMSGAQELKSSESWLRSQQWHFANKKAHSPANYIELVEEAVGHIKHTSELDKIVLSRFVEEQTGGVDFSWLDQVRQKYPNAFVAMVSAADFGTWLVASPELFLSRKESVLKSFSLAGTKTSKTSALGSKEKQEQSIVTKFIEEVFEHHHLNFRTLENIEHPSGHLTHLLNVVQAESVGSLDLSAFLANLHPTPAVGGQPKDAALNFIKKNEGYERQLYTGYLGPMRSAKKLDFYVNLRSAQLFEQAVRFYAGAGITAQSDARKEFEETEAKTQVLRKILN